MTQSGPSASPLFSTEPVVVEPRQPPTVVVGMPRSGSTFLSHVMSCLDDWYVFDDLYFYQQVRSFKINGPLTEKQLRALVHNLGWTVRARVRWEDNPEFKPQCTWEDVDRMCEAVLETYKGRQVLWHDLMEEWLTRLARHHGCTRWGYKTPQDFMHMDELADVFPGIRFIFVMRDPRKMMASFKFVRREDGFRGQYHPVVYARYWKMAFEAYERFARGGKAPILVVRFEQLVADPDGEAERLAEFLGTTYRPRVAEHSANTSFGGGRRKTLTPTETWMCQKFAGAAMEAAEYPLERCGPRFRDLPDLMATSVRFAGFQLYRLYRWPRDAHTIATFVKRTIGAR